MVGQHLVARLAQHPWFEVGALAASVRSEGKSYREAARWLLPGRPWAGLGDMRVVACDPGAVGDCPLVLSALDCDTARLVEPVFRDAGRWVVTNASAFRLDPTVPLVVPEVNADHLEVLRGKRGGIVANPNCTATPVVMSLAPLRSFGIEAVMVASWQAVSGAGYPGVSAFDILGNAVPHAGDEEEKLALEPAKILGTATTPAAFATSARCVRVPVVDGHLVAVFLRTNRPLTPLHAVAAFRDFRPGLELPSAMACPLVVVEGRDRPNARWDAGTADGMAVTVGRVELCPVMGLKWFALVNNVGRGAAGATILNAELLVKRGFC